MVDNIKTDFQKNRMADIIDWTDLVQDRDMWQLWQTW